MNAYSSSFGLNVESARTRSSGIGNALSLRWAALGEAARVVCMLAGVESEKPDNTIRNFPALMRDAEPWRRQAAENGCADMAAMMEPGLAALLAINARGSDCQAAARALWLEYVTARKAVVALLPPTGELGHRRSA